MNTENAHMSALKIQNFIVKHQEWYTNVSRTFTAKTAGNTNKQQQSESTHFFQKLSSASEYHWELPTLDTDQDPSYLHHTQPLYSIHAVA